MPRVAGILPWPCASNDIDDTYGDVGNGTKRQQAAADGSTERTAATRSNEAVEKVFLQIFERCKSLIPLD
jgi:hypothetical protein